MICKLNKKASVSPRGATESGLIWLLVSQSSARDRDERAAFAPRYVAARAQAGGHDGARWRVLPGGGAPAGGALPAAAAQLQQQAALALGGAHRLTQPALAVALQEPPQAPGALDAQPPLPLAARGQVGVSQKNTHFSESDFFLFLTSVCSFVEKCGT